MKIKSVSPACSFKGAMLAKGTPSEIEELGNLIMKEFQRTESLNDFGHLGCKTPDSSGHFLDLFVTKTDFTELSKCLGQFKGRSISESVRYYLDYKKLETVNATDVLKAIKEGLFDFAELVIKSK